MNYAIIDGSTVTKTGTLKTLFPGVSFSTTGPSAEFISKKNIVELVETLSFTEPDQKLTKVDAYLDSGKAYSVKVETCTDDEKAALIASQWLNIKSQRYELLVDTDWRASSDLTLSDEWKNYRQALRDITTTQSDPYNITWPTPPS
jgi:hypothetical protein